MPLQNRVTPAGEIVATPHRGMFTGNRGIIHDPATRTLLARRWANKAWLTCVCEFKGRRREVMGGRNWTELFFLDEATAFAAGHRPCFFCRRDDANRFRAASALASFAANSHRSFARWYDGARRHGELPDYSEPDAVVVARRISRRRAHHQGCDAADAAFDPARYV